MFILCALVLLLAAELSLRVYHRRAMRAALPSELRPETRELTWDDIKDKYRIVCFGDSITYGEDLPSAQAYPAVLANLLEQRHPGLDLVVVNSGMRGHTSVQGLARLDRDVLWYKPHVVLSAFGVNDGNLGRWPLDPIRERRVCGDSSLPGRVWPVLFRSHLWQTLRGRTRRMLRRLGWLERPRRVPKGEPKPRVSRRGFEIAQKQLAARILNNGCDTLLLMTTTPVSETFRQDLGTEGHRRQLAIYDEYSGIVRDVAEDHGACLLDLGAALASQGQGARALAADGVHLTAAGERLVAQSVAQVLEERGLPGSRPYQRR